VNRAADHARENFPSILPNQSVKMRERSPPSQWLILLICIADMFISQSLNRPQSQQHVPA
jgi:hypothetical protein